MLDYLTSCFEAARGWTSGPSLLPATQPKIRDADPATPPVNGYSPVSFHPTWATDTVQAMAQAIYEDRTLPSGYLDGRRMSLLADALE